MGGRPKFVRIQWWFSKCLLILGGKHPLPPFPFNTVWRIFGKILRSLEVLLHARILCAPKMGLLGYLWCNSVNADPPPPFWKFTRAPMSFCLFVCSSKGLLRFSVFVSACPHVPPAPLFIRLLNPLRVPLCSTISLSYRHSVFTLRLTTVHCPSILGKAYAYSSECASPN